MKIPYGIADFKSLREQGLLFVDKSAYIRLLESHETGAQYVAWLRPRRFGKSLLLSMLASYYDVKEAALFERLFGDLDIGQHPTPERNRYLIFRMEFTGLSATRSADNMEADFLLMLRSTLSAFVERYRELLPSLGEAAARVAQAESPALGMKLLLQHLATTPYKLYILIDEYDNFTNDLVFRGRHKTYAAILQGAGFMREFFKTLKEGTAIGAIARIFITGVSPVTIDDLGSGANIFTYPYLEEPFEGMCGFTEAELHGLLGPRLAELGQTSRLDELLEKLRHYYNGYRFSLQGGGGVFNPDMVLYFLRRFNSVDVLPVYMLDENLRMDYGKLRALMAGNQDAPRPENMETLLEVMSTGELHHTVHPLFPLSRAWEPEYFASLLFYHGLLTLDADPHSGKLVVPNFVIRELLWENVRDMLGEVCEATPPPRLLEQAFRTLARAGDPQPFLRLVQSALFQKLSRRDLIRFNEASVKLLLLSWLSLRNYFLVFSELEHIGGYSDLILVPSVHHPWVKYCVLLELKYLKLKEYQKRGLEAVEEQLAEGEEQLLRYANDPRLEGFRARAWTRYTVVFAGSREIYLRTPGGITTHLEPEPEEDHE